jgi:hypothetical protein
MQHQWLTFEAKICYNCSLGAVQPREDSHNILHMIKRYRLQQSVVYRNIKASKNLCV